MKKKILVLLVAVAYCFVLSVSAFAATPSYDSSVNGSKALTADECIAWLISDDINGLLTEENLNAGYTWSVFEDKNYVTATMVADPTFGYQFFYDDSGLFTVDMYSGSSVTRIAGNTSSGSENTGSSSSGSIGDIISDVNTASSGLFKMGTSAFDLMLSNPICFLFLGSGFCFTALGLARKAMRASKKS